ncbi:MAG TPA: ERF family protein [Rhodanobacteraceae bacterium]|nr:ERF family protein [Rhodanobacteraceae bacterium]
MNAQISAEIATIYPALVRVSRAIAAEGIGKSRDNKQQGYKFRGVDEVMNAFAPLFAKEGIFIRPRFEDRQVSERVTKSGGVLYAVSVQGSFDFVAEDGSSVTVGPFFGEAMDSGDKATNKAMAVAFKYAMFQAFCVPLEGVTGGDADSVTHEETVPKGAHSTRPGQPMHGVWDGLDEAQRETINRICATVAEYMETGDVQGAQEHIESKGLMTEEKAALWSILPRTTRTAFKKAKTQEIVV